MPGTQSHQLYLLVECSVKAYIARMSEEMVLFDSKKKFKTRHIILWLNLK